MNTTELVAEMRPGISLIFLPQNVPYFITLFDIFLQRMFLKRKQNRLMASFKINF